MAPPTLLAAVPSRPLVSQVELDWALGVVLVGGVALQVGKP